MNPRLVTADLKRLRKAAHDWVESGKNDYDWLGKQEQRHQQDVHARDGLDLLAIHNAVKAREWDYAWCLTGKLDTIVRDQIPCRLYNLMAKVNGAG